MATLVYSDDCPYCQFVAWLIGVFDVAGFIDRIPIESDRGQALLTRWHGPDHPHAPHLRAGTRLWWGVWPVGWRVVVAVPFLVFWGVLVVAWRKMKTTAATLRG